MGSVLAAAQRLRNAMGAAFAPRGSVAFVYDPLDYAWAPHETYARRYGDGPGAPRDVLFVGMNPGPWGMGQTGVPFGDVTMVRDWMGIVAPVGQPARLHPKRPVTGFATTRSEPSGTRLYGWAKTRYGSAKRFFDHCFVVNYCPLLLFDVDGKNLTPDKLPARDTTALFAACDAHVVDVVAALRPRVVAGVGAFATARARTALAGHDADLTIGTVLHPSPASPLANKGWAQQAEKQLAALGVPLP